MRQMLTETFGAQSAHGALRQMRQMRMGGYRGTRAHASSADMSIVRSVNTFRI